MNKGALVRIVRELADKVEEMTEADWSACPDSPDGECRGRPEPTEDGFIRTVICSYCGDTLWKSNAKAAT
jgi:hypothetical protein